MICVLLQYYINGPARPGSTQIRRTSPSRRILGGGGAPPGSVQSTGIFFLVVANGRWAFEKPFTTAAAAIALVCLRHAFEEWVRLGASGCRLRKKIKFNLTPRFSKDSRCHTILLTQLRVQYIEVEKRDLI